MGLLGELVRTIRVFGPMASAKGVEVGKKVLVGRHDLARGAVVVGVEEVFDKVWREDDDLVARIENGVHDDVERAPGPHGHEDVVGRKGQGGLY